MSTTACRPARAFIGGLCLVVLAGTALGQKTDPAASPRTNDTEEMDRLSEPTAWDGEEPYNLAAAGPDVIVGEIYDVDNYGSVGGIAAFSIGTISCNAGDQPAQWVASTNQHPVIAQNMYRLKNGRFEHVGQSWLKHGFAALTGNTCGFGCNNPGTSSLLGVGCSDPYDAGLNGSQFNLGPKSDVNAHTGYFPFPVSMNPPIDVTIGRRLQVYERDLDPAQLGGGQYFVEAHYVLPDEATAGNQDNNASYRPINTTYSPGFNLWSISLTGSTSRTRPAVRAWKATDPTVTETDVRVPNEGMFVLSAKATDLGGGQWQYEYALYNLNADRSAGSFSVPITPAATVTKIGFHDVDYHSGEIFDGTDWPGTASGGSVDWSTSPYSANVRANAVRWGTLYNFRFEADVPPQGTVATIGLFKPGTPTSVAASTIGPLVNTGDCNENGVEDSLDILDGTSQDCNGNWIPDECETFSPTPIRATRVASGLSRPVYITSAPGDPSRQFIVEQGGRIKILSGGVVFATPFLNISSLITSDGERGLLSMAFHPNYGSNGYFYVNYTNLSGDTVIARYRVSPNPNVADAGSAVILKTINQDFANHNGGQLQFGPDGYMYVGMGDGGSGNDPLGRAQDPGTLLGKMLRLDVDAPPNYIPPGNPFVGPGLPLDEIWSSGWRNPWRFSFDRLTGDIYIGDVGQASWEEIDFEPAGIAGGRNYGWRCMEGFACTGLTGCTCNSPALTLPIHAYSHGGDACSVTGGYVYRGCGMPDLSGTYFFADYCSNEMFSFRYKNGGVIELSNRTAELTPDTGAIIDIVSFGEDTAGELYIVAHGGSIYKIVPDAGGPLCGDGVREGTEECDDGNTQSGDGCSDTCLIEPGGGNNLCAEAVPIGEGTFPFDTTNATTDGPAEPGVCDFLGDNNVASDIWFCYTASCTGTATVRLCTSTYDTKLAVYEGCTCPTVPSAVACNDDSCGLQSELVFPVTGCGSYLIRVGGFQGAQGPGSLDISCQPAPVAVDCNGNGRDDSVDVACGFSDDADGNGVPDECETGGDTVRGGRMYDRWWAVTGAAPPAVDHPLWEYRPDQTSNLGSGSTTWRCKECHGWDYVGADGQYATGPHRTGFPGVLGTSLGVNELFTLLREPPNNGGGPGVPNGHDYGAVLSDADIIDLVAFTLLATIDDDPYINRPTGIFLGDAETGQDRYQTQGSISCISCHGADGTAINFGTFADPEYVGTIATHEPWEFMHKVRFGQPGTPMPSWMLWGGTNQGVADIGRYAQVSFPVDCVENAQCDDAVACTVNLCDGGGRCVFPPDDGACPDDGVFCNGARRCDAQLGCVDTGSPCVLPALCNEGLDRCECSTPLVAMAGDRYLEVTLQPTDSAVPVALTVAAACAGATPKYVGPPVAPWNVAQLVDNPASAAWLTPSQWNTTVYLYGADIVPDTPYELRADCGTPGTPALTSASTARTARWGDAAGDFVNSAWEPPDGQVDILDVTAILDGFRHLPTAPPLYACDIWSCLVDQDIDIVDAVGALDGFRGLSFTNSTVCVVPCP